MVMILSEDEFSFDLQIQVYNILTNKGTSQKITEIRETNWPCLDRLINSFSIAFVHRFLNL